MRNILCCSLSIATIAAAPAAASSDPTGNHAAPAIGSQVVANGSEAIAPLAGDTAQPSAEKRICRQLPSSYSRMTQRTCLTAKQWEQVERDSQ